LLIETERLVIRDLGISDVEALARTWCDPDVTRFMGGPRDAAEVRRILAEDARSTSPPAMDLWPVLEKRSGQVVGQCGLLEKEVDGQAEVELVYVLARAAWGRGYATEAAAAIQGYAREHLGLQRLIALIDPENGASERVALKVGLRLERKTLRHGGKLMCVYAWQAEEVENVKREA
jgi:ribosomal-protein-alanine N-acetyltransferase